MSGAVSTVGRSIRRQVCSKHGLEYGQTYVPAIPNERESFWEGNCRECEADIRCERRIADQIAMQTADITAEAERRIAADAEFEQRVSERAAADLTEEVTQVVATHCAIRRPEWEEYHRNLEWNRVVAQIETERREEFLQQFRTEEK